MQFKVPQFLDIEDKIFGPFTFRQFVYLAGGAGLCFVFYRLLGLFWGAIPILFVGTIAGLLTFYRPNNKPFIFMLESAFKYLTQNKLYIWKKDTSEQGPQTKKAPAPEQTLYQGRRLDQSKLRDLAWSLDVLDLNRRKQN